jgi:hypothetical protein
MKWGEPTWTLMHWLAENVNDNHFNSERLNIITIISKILRTLPCSLCKNHASEYNKRYPLDKMVYTKEDLRLWLFYFHNTVNNRKKYNVESIDILNKYKSIHITNVLQNWLNNYCTGNNIQHQDFFIKHRINDVKKYVVLYLRAKKHKFTNS